MPTLASKWMQQGIQQGMQQGRQEGKAETLLSLLEIKFGSDIRNRSPGTPSALSAACSCALAHIAGRFRASGAPGKRLQLRGKLHIPCFW